MPMGLGQYGPVGINKRKKVKKNKKKEKDKRGNKEEKEREEGIMKDSDEQKKERLGTV